jgi:hypothetical protein
MMVMSATAQERLYSLKNIVWGGNDSNTYFFILKNNKNCLKCFSDLSGFLAENYTGCCNVIGSVSQTDSSVFARKIEAAEVNKMMPEVSLVLFDYRRDVMDDRPSFFSKYRVDITPCLVVVKGGRQFFYGYEQLFAGKFVNKGILERINKQIADVR